MGEVHSSDYSLFSAFETSIPNIVANAKLIFKKEKKDNKLASLSKRTMSGLGSSGLDPPEPATPTATFLPEDYVIIALHRTCSYVQSVRTPP